MDKVDWFVTMRKVTNEYERGLITGVEFLAEIMALTKAIEDQRNSSTIKRLGLDHG